MVFMLQVLLLLLSFSLLEKEIAWVYIGLLPFVRSQKWTFWNVTKIIA